MEVDDRPPGRPPDPNIRAEDRNTPTHERINELYTPILTAPLANFESIESVQRRKRALEKECDTEISNPKQQRHIAPPRYSRSRYSARDVAPFMVHVTRSESDLSSGTTLHPIKFGQLMLKLNIKNVLPDGIKKIGRNRISVQFKAPEDANTFLANSELINKGYDTSIPTYNITRMGIVRGVPVEWSDAEVIDNIKPPMGCGEILKVRRLNHKVINNDISEWKPTSSVVITFDGQTLPNRVFCCYNSLPVNVYYFPTIQCFACCKYGHTKTQCRSKPCCYRCGDEHLGDGCTVEDLKCFYCSGPHNAISKLCPEFVRQKNIKVIMAENNISYAEASKTLPPIFKSYAEVTTSNSPPSQPTHTIASQKSQLVTTPHSSYRKTIINKQKTRTPLPTGYDRRSHNEIINSYSFSPSVNGCALNSSDSHYNDPLTDTETLVILLTKILTKINIPDHVADNIIQQILTHQNGHKVPTMEC